MKSQKNRYKIIIEYDGSGFSGWQSQNSVKPGVQDVIKNGLEKLGYLNIQIYGAGRTDSGVHALGQVAHFDLNEEIIINKFIKSLNFFIRDYPVVIVKVEKVDENFDARFSAKKRRYLYKIAVRKTSSVIQKNRIWDLGYDLNINKMKEAANIMLGYHDFKNFRLKSCQAKNSCRTISQLNIIETKIEEQNLRLIEFDIIAKSFLHRQVRIIVGTLCQVGRGRITCEDISDSLTKLTPINTYHAPPWGLYLYGVYY
ncbi:tRNA pseudouridine(38-40) synthase TruA [Lyticum sinuosum]|uniref:tRNA pseudouridine synthase A n=1 Tax=Lyticum sinuosum TaxID=1332059 RepID=A0AAE4VL08_9RICK|nr:tRNA pseudouridine(38-40) synthase TruA [Lyticum sinuosum]MDZ5761017.1 tRNA pseudouridine synthase A [Lyticum sinuosum]